MTVHVGSSEMSSRHSQSLSNCSNSTTKLTHMPLSGRGGYFSSPPAGFRWTCEVERAAVVCVPCGLKSDQSPSAEVAQVASSGNAQLTDEAKDPDLRRAVSHRVIIHTRRSQMP